MESTELKQARLKENARNRKYYNKEHIDKLTAGLINYYSDPQKKARLAYGLCKYCFYVHNDRIGGAAITYHKCDNCGKEMNFGNTCTDNFCLECAIELKHCKHCGAKQD